MVHIDKYKIYSYGKSWNKNKEAKTETIQKMLTSEECISGKQFLQLLSVIVSVLQIVEIS